MARNCVYTFTDRDGREKSVKGPAALKAYLAEGGLEHLMAGLKLPSTVTPLRSQTALGTVKPREGYFANAGEAQAYLRDQFGVGIDNLISRNELNFTFGKATWPEAVRNAAPVSAEAVYFNSKAYIDLQATRKERLTAVTLHELGEHYNLARMLGEKNYRSLQQSIANRAKIVGSEASKVWADVKRLYPHLQEGSDHFISEVIAKLGEQNPNAPWYRRLLAQIKSFLVSHGLGRGFITGTMTEADLHDLLIASLKSAADGRVLDKARVYQPTPQFAFAGEKAETADLHALSTAQARLANGEDPEKVRKETGWHKSIDNRWKYEIDDSQATLNLPRGGVDEFTRTYRTGATVKDLLNHPVLFAAYPKLANVPVGFVNRTLLDGASGGVIGNRIALARDMRDKDIKSVLMHEIQHIVQEHEGFAVGATPESVTPSNYRAHQIEMIDHLHDALTKAKQKGDQKQVGKLTEQLGVIEKAASFDAYKRVAGEVEARNVQARLGLSAKERMKTPPKVTQDKGIRDDDIIVVFNGKEMKDAPRMANVEREELPEKINIDGVERWTVNSNGQLIHPTEEGIRNFWKWFGDSKVVDDKGRPLVVYHGTHGDINAFRRTSKAHLGFHFGDTEASDTRLDDTAMPRIDADEIRRLQEAHNKAYLEYRRYEDSLNRKKPDIPTEEIAQALESENVDKALSDVFDRYKYIPTKEESQELARLKNIADSRKIPITKYGIGSNVLPVYLSSSKLLRMPDVGNWGSVAGIKKQLPFDSDATTLKGLVEDISSRGYDGIVYANRVETPVMRTDSYIVFDPSQIKSAIGNTGDFSTESNDIRFSIPSEPTERFYSQLSRAVENAPEKVFTSPQQLKLWLGANAEKMGVKKDELFWSGVGDYLDSLEKGKVSREQILGFLKENGVKVEEVVLGSNGTLPEEYAINERFDRGEINRGQRDRLLEPLLLNRKHLPPKHNNEQLTLPGGRDYREVVLTIPTIEKFNESDATHFGDVSGGKHFAWYRSNVRTDATGKDTLFMEEVQSQRAQEGRKKGFESPNEKLVADNSNGYWEIRTESGKFVTNVTDPVSEDEAIAEARRRIVNAPQRTQKGVPPSPFVTDANNKATNAYINLVLKKAVSQAVDSGQSSVSWTTGDQQADRYDLSKLVDELHWYEEGSTLQGFKDGEEVDYRTGVTADNLDTFVGKDIAKRLIDAPVDNEGLRSLYNEELKIGGQWAQTMYGNGQGLDANGKPSLILQAAKDVARRMGGKTGTVKLNTGTQPALLITPEMREKVLKEGMPLFSIPAGQTAPTDQGIPSAMDQVRKKFRDMTDKVFSEKYAFLSARQLIEISKDYLPEIAPYEAHMQDRRTYIDSWLRQAQHILDKARKLSKQENRDLGEVMFGSTLPDVDASRAWSGVEKIWSDKASRDVYRAFSQTKFTPARRQALNAKGVSLGAIDVQKTYADFASEQAAKQYLNELNLSSAQQADSRYAKGIPDENPRRQEKHKGLQKQFQALPDTAKTVYRETHELHTSLYNAKFDALIKRVEEGVLEASRRKQLIALLRLQFESNALSFYYAPLFRHGPYWFYGMTQDAQTGEEIPWFQTFESKAGRDESMEDFKKRHGANSIVGAGTSSRDMDSIKRLSGSDAFVKDVNSIIDNANLDPAIADKIQDDIYQMYLESLPQVSMRHSGQHRKNTLGFETDWQMGFAHNMHHGSSQVANMTHGRFMEKVLDDNDAALKLAEFPRSQQEAETDIRLLEELAANWNNLSRPGEIDDLLDEADVQGDLDRAKELEKLKSWVAKYGRTAPVDVGNDISNRLADAKDQGDSREVSRLGALQNTMPEFLEWAKAGQLSKLSSEIQKAESQGQGMKAAALKRIAEVNALYRDLAESNALEAVDYARREKERILKASRSINLSNSHKARLVIDELRRTYNAMTTTNSTAMDRVAGFARQLGFMFHLGFSLSSAAINMLQTPGVAAPILIGKFGNVRSWSALGTAYQEFLQAMDNGWRDGKRDADGNISITTVLKDERDALLRTDPANPKVGLLNDTIDAMETFKDGGDISRTQTMDVIGVGQEGEEYGGALLEFNKLSGALFHHGERMNREITLKAAYTLAREKGVSHEEAIDYARWVNNRAHLDYSPENAARVFRGWPAAIALQFKKYSQGMLYNYGRFIQESLLDARKAYESMPEGEAKRQLKERAVEARKSLGALLTMQVAFAGALGLPLEGVLRVVLNTLWSAFPDDDDEPKDIEAAIRTKLTHWGGETFATAVTRGVFNAFTPLSIAPRMEMSDIMFREPLKEQEGRDAAINYLADLFGPTGGMFQNWFEGAHYMADGEVWRGAEKLLPKALSDVGKAMRYWNEDAQTLNDQKIKDMSATESLFQGLGFASSGLEKVYAERGYVMAAQQAIQDARSEIVHKAASARLKGERLPMAEIHEWNKKHPSWPIRSENIKESVSAQKKHERNRGERGYEVNPRLDYLYEKYRLTD